MFFRKKKEIPENEYTEEIYDDFYIEADTRYNGSAGSEYSSLDTVDIEKLYSLLPVSEELLYYRPAVRKFEKLFDKARDYVEDYVSYEGGRSFSDNDKVGFDDITLFLEITVSKASDDAPYKVTLEIKDSYDE